MSKPAVYMDSCCFIDIVATSEGIETKEDRTREVWFYRKLLEASKNDEITVITSYLTIVECTFVRNKEDKKILTDEVKRLFNSIILSGLEGVRAVFPTHDVIERARQLNWDHDITCKPFDSLHIATALKKKCVEFITTDIGSIDRNGNIEKIKALGLNIIKSPNTKILPESYTQEDIFNGIKKE